MHRFQSFIKTSMGRLCVRLMPAWLMREIWIAEYDLNSGSGPWRS